MAAAANKIRTVFLLLCFLPAVHAAGQDLAAARQLLQEKRVVAAKEAIDNYTSDAGATDADGWLLRGEIYVTVSRTPELNGLVANGLAEGFTAVKKAAAIDPVKTGNYLNNSNFELLQTIYKGFASNGASLFNAGIERRSEGAFARALDQFKQALAVQEFAAAQGWLTDFVPVAPAVLYNAAQAAINAQQEDAALLYCGRIVRAGITAAGPYQSADFEHAWQWLTGYYNTKKDWKNMLNCAEKGAKAFPQSLYFYTAGIYAARQSANPDALLSLYAQANQQFPQHTALLYNYCSDLFSILYNERQPKPEAPAGNLAANLEKALNRLVAAEPDSGRGYLLLGKHHYNAAVNNMRKKNAHRQAQDWLRKAVSPLQAFLSKPATEADRREALQLLVNAFTALGDKAAAERYNLQLNGYQ